MGSHDPDPSRERRAGFVTLVVILVSTLGIVLTTQIDWRRHAMYRLALSMNQDAGGIAIGTPVHVGGIRYGQVIGVVEGAIPAEGATAPTLHGTLVEFEIDASVRLWSGARIYRQATMLGGNVSIEIADTGYDPRMIARQPLPAGTTIRASNPTSGLNALLGPKTAGHLGNFLDDFGPFRDWFANEGRPDASARFDRIWTPFQQLRGMLRADIDLWSPRVAALKTSAGSLVRQLGIGQDKDGDPQSLAQSWSRVAPIRADFNAAKLDFDASAADLRDRIAPKLQKSFDDFKDCLARARTELGSLVDANTAFQADYAAMLANFSLGGGQISRLFSDVMASLVRALLEKPDGPQIAWGDEMMSLRQIDLQADEVRNCVRDLDTLADRVQAASPDTAAQMRRRIEAAMASLRRSLDALNASLVKPTPP
jgi:hypothetical protein